MRPSVDGVGSGPRRQAVAEQLDREGTRAEVPGAADSARRRPPDGLRRNLPPWTQSHDHQPGTRQTITRMDVGHRAGLGRKRLGVEDAFDRAAGAPVERRERLRKPLLSGDEADHDGVDGEVAQRLAGDADPEGSGG